ncbi:hypothetical protein R3P38DRAFT_2696322 [Favolaschia claudopus]|uniref:Arrestin-like N-terminal domain-containing protein n=1 Tax=Favolaschia claudopus TaxID=2862362 RepID=A0AAW0CHU5_9AGAR
MSLAIDIVPLTNSLDMYGAPHNSSAFSLSGHVSISLNSSFSVFERRRTGCRVVLHSVLLTFDGQTETITSSLGYSPLRLYTLSRELLSSGPIELSDEGQEETNEASRWNIVFDLAIPGWLPASHEFGINEAGASTKYFLRAEVKFAVVEECTASWSLASLCSPFRSRTTIRSMEARKKIPLRRFVEPPTDEPTSVEFINYLLSSPNKSPENPIPSDVLSKIQVLASVPAHVDVRENSLPFILRLRTKDLNAAECQRLRITSFTIDIVQTEICRRVKDASKYQATYPVPSQDLQPPKKPLCQSHYSSDMYKLGLFLSPSVNASSENCSASLLPGEETGVYRLTGDSHIFNNDSTAGPETWYTLDTTIPFVHSIPSWEASPDWEGSAKLRPSVESPLFDVTHSLKLAVCCEYDAPGSSEPAMADLTFALPIKFGRVAPPLPPRDILPALLHSMHLVDGSYPAMPSILPYGANLPVYSQLFDSRGNRKVDNTPLPLYTPRSSIESESFPIYPSPLNEKQTELHATTV